MEWRQNAPRVKEFMNEETCPDYSEDFDVTWTSEMEHARDGSEWEFSSNT